ncbi:MAG: hypothetical protein CMC57_02925 [Flavobacteriaceae bacterium]|nr:hypothetical protein [Flavobacteriaceae bacterium]|tara:strand:- start:381 stop:899 length:519 start_codon:yes stop_codon:yes gene_type:complete
MKNEKLKHKGLIIFVSILIPLVVLILFNVRLPNVEPLYSLPPIYATINGMTAIILIFSLLAIKAKKIKTHEVLMKVAIALSLIFLIMYVAYHMTSEPTPFGGDGYIKYFYYFILITHIFLSIFIIPLVLITYVRAISRHFDSHRRIAKVTFPMWLYIAITGVIVYIMISPYY